jgi:hypothetical protein
VIVESIQAMCIVAALLCIVGAVVSAIQAARL